MLIVAYKYITLSRYISIKQKPKINVQKKNVNKTKQVAVSTSVSTTFAFRIADILVSLFIFAVVQTNDAPFGSRFVTRLLQ